MELADRRTDNPRMMRSFVPPRAAMALALSVMTGACASTGGVPRPFPTPGSSRSEPSGETAGAPAPVAGDPADAVDDYALVGTALSLRGTPYRNGGSDSAGSTAAASRSTSTPSTVCRCPGRYMTSSIGKIGEVRRGRTRGSVIFYDRGARSDACGDRHRRRSIRPCTQLDRSGACRTSEHELLVRALSWRTAHHAALKAPLRTRRRETPFVNCRMCKSSSQ